MRLAQQQVAKALAAGGCCLGVQAEKGIKAVEVRQGRQLNYTENQLKMVSKQQ